MSVYRPHKIKCPECGEEGFQMIWHSANVDSDPEIREKVKNGTLFAYTCEKCCKTFNVEYTFLYHDMKNKFMIYYITKPEINTSFEDEINNSDAYELFSNQGYTFRIVYDKVNLIDKIRIFENGLNDIAVEILKWIIKNNLPNDEVNNVNKIIFNKVENENLVFSILFANNEQTKGAMLSKEGYENLLNDLKYNNYDKTKFLEINMDTVFQYVEQ